MYRETGNGRRRLERSTLAVTSGRPQQPDAPLNGPPVFASAFRTGDGPGYSRESNPTWDAFEHALGELEGGAAVAFGSGMAAASAVIDELAPGARVAIGASSYVEVRRLLEERRQLGTIELTEVDDRDEDRLIAAAAGADLLWLDAISNPALEVPALDVILPMARARGTTCVVDATLATPMLIRPLALGADLVLHSASKYLGGHSDLLLGAVIAANPRRADRLRDRRASRGAVPGTMEAWLALRGMRTLAVRVERAGRSAAELAAHLCRRADVPTVRYPGLPGDPAHATATRVLEGFGAVVSFDLGDRDRADAVCASLELIAHAGSLGGVETVIDRQARWHAEPAVPAGLLRLSVGCEDPRDLWSDLERALNAAAARTGARSPRRALR